MKKQQKDKGKLNSPDVVQENIGHHFGSCYNWALGFVESAGVVFNVAHLPHQGRDSPDTQGVVALDLRSNDVVQRRCFYNLIPWVHLREERLVPVEAVLQSFADGAKVGGVSHHSAVQRVVPQVYW